MSKKCGTSEDADIRPIPNIYPISHSFHFIRKFMKTPLKFYTSFGQWNKEILLVLGQGSNIHNFP